MRHVAIIGSGPAGYYTAEACQKSFGDGVRVFEILEAEPPNGKSVRSDAGQFFVNISAETL